MIVVIISDLCMFRQSCSRENKYNFQEICRQHLFQQTDLKGILTALRNFAKSVKQSTRRKLRPTSFF